MAEVQDDTKWCKNCKRDIASANFLMHEVHCHRNIVLCEHCEEPVPRTELDEHFTEYHAPVKCDLCSGSFPKEDLDTHKENDCPKRSMKCIYCDLEMPQCELQEHLDYCGTRTEMCLKCKQYVMHKDLLQHEENGCDVGASKKVPQRAPKNTNGALGGARLDCDYGHFGSEPDSRYSNSFAMDELSRILDEPSPATRRGNQLTSLARPNNLRSTQNRTEIGNSSQLHTRNDIQGTSRRRPAAQTTKKATNRKETKNLDRERGRSNLHRETTPSSSNSYGNDVDMDYLLAMHMDNDLNSYVPNENDSESNPPVPVQEVGALLPCEFCNELVPAEDLILHQMTCNPAMYDDIPSETSDSQAILNNDITLPNNSPSRPLPPGGTRAQPQIVDNLSYMAAHNRLADPSDLHLNPGIDEDFLLPCEFCDSLLPGDFLIQHQAVCDKNTQRMTPRLPSPAMAPRRSHHNNSQRSRSGSQRSTPKSRSSYKNVKSNIHNPQADNFNSFHNPSEWRAERRTPEANNHRPEPPHNPQPSSFNGRVYNNTRRKKNNGRTEGEAPDDGNYGSRRGSQRRDWSPQETPSYQPEEDRATPRGGRSNLSRPQNSYSRNPAAPNHRQHDPSGITGTSYKRKPQPRDVQPLDRELNERFNSPSGYRNNRGRSRGASSTRSKGSRGRSRRYPQGDA